jgi:hypothetical protein
VFEHMFLTHGSHCPLALRVLVSGPDLLPSA